MINIVGDICFADGFFDVGVGVGSAIKRGQDPFVHIEREPGDYWVGNCECVLSDVSNKTGVAADQFRQSPQKLAHIKHLDLYSIANNHIMQHGPQAYLETQNTILSQGASYMGSADKHAHMFEHQGKKVAIISFSQRQENYSDSPLYWYYPEYSAIEAEVRALRDCVDFVIVYVHWGNEFIDYPYTDQKLFAHWLVDIGVDLVVGLHPHVLQGYEQYRGKHIFYSIGNFVFNMPTEATRYSCIVQVDLSVSEEPRIGYRYVKIGIDHFPSIIEKEELPHRMSFEELEKKLSIGQENEVYYHCVQQEIERFQKKNRLSFLRSFFDRSLQSNMDVLIDFVRRRI